jgi:hypothetical protein
MYTCPFYCVLIAIQDFVYYNIMDSIKGYKGAHYG